MKKRIQLTINEELLAKADQLCKKRHCDSISELVTDLLKEEEAKQRDPQADQTYPAHRPQSLALNDTPTKKKKTDEGKK